MLVCGVESVMCPPGSKKACNGRVKRVQNGPITAVWDLELSCLGAYSACNGLIGCVRPSKGRKYVRNACVLGSYSLCTHRVGAVCSPCRAVCLSAARIASQHSPIPPIECTPTSSRLAAHHRGPLRSERASVTAGRTFHSASHTSRLLPDSTMPHPVDRYVTNARYTLPSAPGA